MIIGNDDVLKVVQHRLELKLNGGSRGARVPGFETEVGIAKGLYALVR